MYHSPSSFPFRALAMVSCFHEYLLSSYPLARLEVPENQRACLLCSQLCPYVPGKVPRIWLSLCIYWLNEGTKWTKDPSVTSGEWPALTPPLSQRFCSQPQTLWSRQYVSLQPQSWRSLWPEMDILPIWNKALFSPVVLRDWVSLSCMEQKQKLGATALNPSINKN